MAEIPALPIDVVIPDILARLQHQPNLVLKAPPGAGKTTRVPLALLDAPWMAAPKIIVIEPRRVAARGAARRMAQSLGEEVGQTIGWRMRLDTKVGPTTRIEVMTDGLFTRRLQSDPELSGIGAVLFDEFHERRLDSDLGLALALESQGALRPDLRLIAMSATLDDAGLAQLMQAPVIETQGRAYPVDTRYLPPERRRIEEDVAAAIRASLQNDRGDILVFLPGFAEIERVRRDLGNLSDQVIVHVLHGDLSADAQDRAIRPDPSRRKVILSTAIAETSLTIDGVLVVIDAGLMRLSRYDPNSGMSRLETVSVTLAAAEQRRGRAGRTAPGICYRLWAEAETRGLIKAAAPEIAQADLSSLMLELALWGARDGAGLPFLDQPPRAHRDAALDLLGQLGLVHANGTISDHGRQCAALGLHPRLAHMLIRAREFSLGRLGAYLAALLSDRDPMRGAGADITSRLEALVAERTIQGDAAAFDRMRRLARPWMNKSDPPLVRPIDPHDLGLLIALAYPDRVAARRGGAEGSFRLANGRGAQMDTADPLSRQPYLSIADLDGPARGAKIRLAAPISLAQIDQLFGPAIVTKTEITWNSRDEAVNARIRRVLGELVLEDRAQISPPADQVLAAMIDGIRQMGLGALDWTTPALQWRARLALVAGHMPEGSWPDISDEALLADLDHWLGPDLGRATRRAHLKEINISAALSRLLDFGQQRRLDQLAPTHLIVPTGSSIALDYTMGELPVLAVRLQEMFGLSATPRICDGRVGVLLHLLSPAGRPVQITADLAGFWQSSYAAVRADLRGRYPKHAWPDDPANAQPLRGTKRQGQAPR